jgi:hypothetical protein
MINRAACLLCGAAVPERLALAWRNRGCSLIDVDLERGAQLDSRLVAGWITPQEISSRILESALILISSTTKIGRTH